MHISEFFRRNASPLIFGFLLLFCACFAHSQSVNVRVDGVVASRSGAPAAGAFVAVCTQPAVTSTTPCTPAAPLCSSLSDTLCTQTNPVQADGLGNYHFYVRGTSLPVTIQYYGPTVTTYFIPDQNFGAGGTTSNGQFVTLSATNGIQALPPSLPYLVLSPEPSGTCPYPIPLLGSGQGVLCNLGNNTFQLNFGFGNQMLVTCRNPVGAFTNGMVCSYNATDGTFEYAQPALNLPLAQIGDTIRFNVNGDNAWDAVNATTNASWVIPDASSASDAFNCFGAFASQCVLDTKSSFSNVQPNGSASYGRTLTSAASASTSTVVGMHSAENGNNSLAGILSFYRLSHKLQINNITNSRWWVGVSVWNSTSALGVNNAQIDGTTAYANDLPNKTTLGFRLSGGTDAHWQCVSIVAGTPLSTVVDTGVVPDITAPHQYELATNSNGTAVYCIIDHNLVATITTNLPVPGGTADTLASPFFTGDNKNTATSISATWYSTYVSYK